MSTSMRIRSLEPRQREARFKALKRRHPAMRLARILAVITALVVLFLLGIVIVDSVRHGIKDWGAMLFGVLGVCLVPALGIIPIHYLGQSVTDCEWSEIEAVDLEAWPDHFTYRIHKEAEELEHPKYEPIETYQIPFTQISAAHHDAETATYTLMGQFERSRPYHRDYIERANPGEAAQVKSVDSVVLYDLFQEGVLEDWLQNKAAVTRIQTARPPKVRVKRLLTMIGLYLFLMIPAIALALLGLSTLRAKSQATPTTTTEEAVAWSKEDLGQIEQFLHASDHPGAAITFFEPSEPFMVDAKGQKVQYIVAFPAHQPETTYLFGRYTNPDGVPEIKPIP